MKIRYILTTMAIALLLTGCGGGYPDSTKVPAKYMPKVNPHPKYFMTVKGFIDPRLQQRIHLTIVAEYDNFNPKCNLWISHFEGADTPWQIFHDYKIKPDNTGHYKIKIPLDHYQPGKCDWDIAGVRYRTEKQSDGDASVLAFFDVKTHYNKSQKFGGMSFNCSHKKYSCISRHVDGFAKVQQFISPKKQHSFYLNFYFKRELV